MIIKSSTPKIFNTKSKILSPLLHNNYNSSDNKRIKLDILTSIIKYKNFPFSDSFKSNIRHFINPFSFLRKNSSSKILLMNNLRNQKQNIKYFKIKKKTTIKNQRNKNLILRNKTINDNKNKRKENEENRFKWRYKVLIRNLSFNGNSKVFFKNLSNEILDNLFRNRPYNSFNNPNVKNNSKNDKKRMKYKYENIFDKIKRNNSSMNFRIKNSMNRRKLNDINSFNNTNIFGFKYTDFNKEKKNINFENQILRNESKDQFSENNQKTSLTSSREKNYLNEKKKLRLKNRIKSAFGTKFHSLKMKLRKQNDVNSNLINNIKKEQSLSKHKLQVGIVKLNGYKTKKRKLNKYNALIKYE